MYDDIILRHKKHLLDFIKQSGAKVEWQYCETRLKLTFKAKYFRGFLGVADDFFRNYIDMDILIKGSKERISLSVDITELCSYFGINTEEIKAKEYPSEHPRCLCEYAD